MAPVTPFSVYPIGIRFAALSACISFVGSMALRASFCCPRFNIKKGNFGSCDEAGDCRLIKAGFLALETISATPAAAVSSIFFLKKIPNPLNWILEK